MDELLEGASAYFSEKADELVLDRDLVIELACEPCDFRRPVLKTTYQSQAVEGTCPQCGQPARPRMTHRIDRDSSLIHEHLADLGIPRYDIVRVLGESGERHFLLAGDQGWEGT